MWCMMWSVMYYSPGWGELVSQSESTFKWCQLSLISRDRRFHGSSGQACRRSQHHSERFHLLARLQQAPFSASCHHVILCCHGDPLARLVIIAQNINLKKSEPAVLRGKVISFCCPERNLCHQWLLSSTWMELITFALHEIQILHASHVPSMI